MSEKSPSIKYWTIEDSWKLIIEHLSDCIIKSPESTSSLERQTDELSASKDTRKGFCLDCEEGMRNCKCNKKIGCGKPYQPIYKENNTYPDDYLICGFSKIGDEIKYCESCMKKVGK